MKRASVVRWGINRRKFWCISSRNLEGRKEGILIHLARLHPLRDWWNCHFRCCCRRRRPLRVAIKYRVVKRIGAGSVHTTDQKKGKKNGIIVDDDAHLLLIIRILRFYYTEEMSHSAYLCHCVFLLLLFLLLIGTLHEAIKRDRRPHDDLDNSRSRRTLISRHQKQFVVSFCSALFSFLNIRLFFSYSSRRHPTCKLWAKRKYVSFYDGITLLRSLVSFPSAFHPGIEKMRKWIPSAYCE